jgi:hypothetical protein
VDVNAIMISLQRIKESIQHECNITPCRLSRAIEDDGERCDIIHECNDGNGNGNGSNDNNDEAAEYARAHQRYQRHHQHVASTNISGTPVTMGHVSCSTSPLSSLPVLPVAVTKLMIATQWLPCVLSLLNYDWSNHHHQYTHTAATNDSHVNDIRISHSSSHIMAQIIPLLLLCTRTMTGLRYLCNDAAILKHLLHTLDTQPHSSSSSSKGVHGNVGPLIPLLPEHNDVSLLSYVEEPRLCNGGIIARAIIRQLRCHVFVHIALSSSHDDERQLAALHYLYLLATLRDSTNGNGDTSASRQSVAFALFHQHFCSSRLALDLVTGSSYHYHSDGHHYHRSSPDSRRTLPPMAHYAVAMALSLLESE